MMNKFQQDHDNMCKGDNQRLPKILTEIFQSLIDLFHNLGEIMEKEIPSK